MASALAKRRARRVGVNVAGLVVAAVALFPVYWMVLTAFRPGSEIRSPTPSFLPLHTTLDNFRRVFERPYFWTSMKNSALVTGLVVVMALIVAFLAAVALARFKFRGRKAFLITVIVVQ